MLANNNLDELKAEIKKLNEKNVEQQVRIKQLEFELEMEQGHVKILKHDNKVLRQTAVEMVITLCIFTLTRVLILFFIIRMLWLNKRKNISLINY